MTATVFAQPSDGSVTPLDGSTRRVILSLPELMLVEFTFVKGGVGALHSHPHVQSSYIAEGSFDVTIDGVPSASRPAAPISYHRDLSTARWPSKPAA